MNHEPGRHADTAILRTLLYADLFDFPLTADEAHHFLIGLSLPRDRVQEALGTSPWLGERVTRVNGYFIARGRDEVASRRVEREQASRDLWPAARRFAAWMGHLPFVRMVAVTGALAMNNSTPGDDIDYIVVTAPGRVWLARALCIAVVRIARRLGVGLCPNYVLSETALTQRRQDLFMAHELAQMVPLVGHALYNKMRRANGWADRYLPNAQTPFRREADASPRGAGHWAQRALEWILRGRLGEALERWERSRKLAKFSRQAALPTSTAQLDADHVKGHFVDYGGPALRVYEERLRHFGIEIGD